jgi:hypothetical protein
MMPSSPRSSYTTCWPQTTGTHPGRRGRTNRSDAREVIRRFREFSTDDQQAVIEFLKQL